MDSVANLLLDEYFAGVLSAKHSAVMCQFSLLSGGDQTCGLYLFGC